MKRLAVLAVLLSVPALAGEKYIGKIVSGAGAATTNVTTATPFFVAKGDKLTLYCSAAAYICVDTATTCTDTSGANVGMPVSATEKFPTSTQMPDTGGPTVPAGTDAARGTYLAIVGPGAVTCYVWSRQGNE